MDLKEAGRKTAHETSRHPWEIARSGVILAMIRDIFPGIRRMPVRILDLGCGDAFVAEHISTCLPNAEVFIADPAFSKDYMKMLSEKYQNRSIKAYRSWKEMPLNTPMDIDLLLLLDVIEHVEKDRQFMASLLNAGMVSFDTKFLVTAPAFQSLFTGHDVYLKHFRRYSLTRLKNTLENAGFHIQNAGYFFSTLLPLRAIKKISESIFGKNIEEEKGIGGWKSIPVVDLLSSKVLLADYRIGRWLNGRGVTLPGLSAFAVCSPNRIE